MKKKSLFLMMAMVLIMTFFTGCSKSDPAVGEWVSVDVMTDSGK